MVFFIIIMKHMKSIAFCAALAAIFSITACDLSWELDNYQQSFARHLQGIWVSNDPSIYSGTLEITFDRITIRGYEEGQTPRPGGDDNQRPFRNFTRRVTLKGYSEERTEANGFILGHIFIEDAGIIQAGIPYTYWYLNSPSGFGRVHFLRFNFGGRDETLQRTE